jgi:hypothetical protein
MKWTQNKTKGCKMRAIVAILGVCFVIGAYAEDAVVAETADVVQDAVVVERETCADISAKIDELSAVVEPDEETVAQIADLKVKHRSNCTRSAGARRAVGRVDDSVVAVTDVATETESADSEQVGEASAEEVSEIITLTPEQAKANLDAGLCADGTKPNRFGCCGEEVFKDLGDTVFACCPKDGGDCFPPLK